MELEWDAEKAALNLRKHGAAFEDAAIVFHGPGRIETHDGPQDYGEDRWATIGRVDRPCCTWSTPCGAKTPSA